jgi:hypothetical protein
MLELSGNIGLTIKNSGFDVALIDLSIVIAVREFITIGSI